MGFLDALLGRSKPAQANLDKLFGLPGAQITLEASEGLEPTGHAGVCFKPASGQAFSATEQEFTQLLNLGDETGTRMDESSDEYGYRWVVITAGDFDSLVTRVHMTNSTLQDNGYGPQLLCSVFGFRPKQPTPMGRRRRTSSTSTSAAPSTRSSQRARSAATTRLSCA